RNSAAVAADRDSAATVAAIRVLVAMIEGPFFGWWLGLPFGREPDGSPPWVRASSPSATHDLWPSRPAPWPPWRKGCAGRPWRRVRWHPEPLVRPGWRCCEYWMA